MKKSAFSLLILPGLLLTACGQDDAAKPSDDSWGTPVELQRVPPLEGVGNGQRLERPTVAVDDQGNGLAVWEEVAVARGFSFPQALWFSSFTPARGWSAAARLERTVLGPSGGTLSLDPRLVPVGAGSFVLAWQSGAHVFVARFDSSSGWGPEQDLGPGGGPALAVNESASVVAAWHGSFDGATETRGILMSRLERNGFSAPLRVDTAQPIDHRPDDPSVALDAAGDATVVFESSLDLRAVRLRAGQVVPEPQVLLVDSTRADLVRGAPATGVDGAGRVVALWRQADAGTSRPPGLWWSRFTPGQGWSTPGALDDASANVGGYSLAVSSGGDAFAAWSLDPAGDVRARHFTAGAWAPSTSLLRDAAGRPVQGAVGPPSLGIDRGGNVWALFASPSSLFENRFARSGGWRGLGVLQGTGQPRVAVASSGEAIVVLSPADLRSVSASRFLRSSL